MSESAQIQKGAAFRALHEGEPFLIPNPWDAGSARVLEALGFRALATTSSGFAFTLGRLDGAVTLTEVIEHVRVVSSATVIPLSVDLESGHGAGPEAAAETITLAAQAGAVGGSIEDWDERAGIYPIDVAAERVAAAAAAARSLDHDFILTARAENHIRDNPNLADTIARLQAYEQAGADVLYAPGLRSADEIRAVRAAVSRPLNVLALPGMSLPDVIAAGAQRVSVGGGLTWTAAEALAQAARQLSDGDLSGLTSSGHVAQWLAARPTLL
jgi:2-methylisocitrate lyase-like PEP mutase family enzyme